MCGISGVAGYLTDQEKKALADLLVLNIVRGVDSTGVGVVPRDEDKDFMTCRALGTPYGDGNESPGLFNYVQFDRVMKVPGKVLLGHNRAATKGDVSVRNAHPFKFSNVMGVHNGTLHHQCLSKLEGLLGTGQKFGTDSELIFACIDKVGFPETVKLLQGAWALVWYDKRDQTLNFCRNKERTLHFIFDEQEKVLLWSSDFSPLMYAVHRQKIQTGDKKPKLFPEDIWMKWKVPAVASKFEEASQEEAKGFTYQSTTYYPTSTGTHRAFPVRDYTNVEYNATTRSYEAKRYDGAFNDTLPWDDDGHRIQSESNSYSVDRSEFNKAPDTNEDAAKMASVIVLHPGINQQQGSPVNATQVARERLLNRVSDKANKLFQDCFGVIAEPWILKFMESFERAYYDDKHEQWHYFKYWTATNHWDHSELPHPPSCVPFRKVNVEAGGCHHFCVKGSNKKKNRVILYKGYNRSLLAKEVFEKITSRGCINCQRSPKWGNIVRFFSHNTFLCEHCERMPSVVRMVGELEIPRKAL